MSLPSEKSQWQLHSFHGSSHKPRVLADGPLSLPFYVQSKTRSCQPYLQSISIQNWPFLSVSTAPIQARATTLSCSQSFLSAFLGPFYSPTQKIRVMTQNLRQLMPLFSELARAVHHTQKGNQGTSTWSAPPHHLYSSFSSPFLLESTSGLRAAFPSKVFLRLGHCDVAPCMEQVPE